MYVKLFSDLADSSVWCGQSACVKLVWIVLLLKANKFGFTPIGVPGLAKAVEMPADEVRQALDVLESPDPESKSTSEEGRRIRREEGGIHIVNYEKYDKIGNQEARRQQNAAHRKPVKESEPAETGKTVGTVPHTHLISSQLNSEKTKRRASATPRRMGSRLSPEWEPSDATKAYAKSKGADWPSVLEEFRLYWLALPGQRATKLDWDLTFRKRVLEASSRQQTVLAKRWTEAKVDVGYTRPPANGAPAWHNEPMITADEHASFAARLAEAVAKVGT